MGRRWGEAARRVGDGLGPDVRSRDCRRGWFAAEPGARLDQVDLCLGVE
jgi:hypothetical protein